MKAFINLALFSVVAFFFAACSQTDVDTFAGNIHDVDNNGECIYTLHMGESTPCYLDEPQTRATTSWANGCIVHLILNNGGKQIIGTAKYNGSGWTLTTNETISPTSSASTCTAGYVEGATLSGTSYTMTPTSIYYMGTGSYTSNSTDVYVNVTLQPQTWRMRFKGAAGTKITLNGSDNDITYLSAISTTTLQGTSQTQNVTLTVNTDGYTPYIYGLYKNTNNNTITLVNESEGNIYIRKDISGTSLTKGYSGYFTIPTNSNYASLQWEQKSTIDPNAYVTLENVIPFVDGMVGAYVVGSTANTFYDMITKDLSRFNNDEEIIADILDGNTAEDATTITGYLTGWWNRTTSFYQPGTTYYYCSIAYNSKGVRGPLKTVAFTTRYASDPIATLSNLGYKTVSGVDKWTFDVTMSNGATKYYINSYQGVGYDTEDNHWLAYYTYSAINEGSLTNTYNYESVSFNRTKSAVAILTVAVDSNGKIGNYSCLQGSTTTVNNAAPVFLAPTHDNKCKEMKQATSKIAKYIPHPIIGFVNN